MVSTGSTDGSGSSGGSARVFLASRNTKKLGEMHRILAAHMPGVEVLGLDDVPAYDEPVEDEDRKSVV